eukprot:3607433-Amphidinium_carterae.1
MTAGRMTEPGGAENEPTGDAIMTGMVWVSLEKRGAQKHGVEVARVVKGKRRRQDRSSRWERRLLRREV